MYQLINESQFRDAFKRCERNNHFSYDGSNALYEYLENWGSDDKGQQLDVIGLCCTYTEYESFDEFKKEYSDTCEDQDIQCVDDIAELTILIKIPDCDYDKTRPTGRFIIEQF